MKKLLIAIIVLGSCSSCSNYYKAILAPQPANADSIIDLNMKNRYFILRNGNEAFAMKDISVSADKKDLKCNLGTVPFDHTLHLNRNQKSKLKYNKAGNTEDESPVLNEVHLYISPDSNIITGPYTLALAKVKKTEVLEEDKLKTKQSHTVGMAVGISAGVVGVVIIAGLAFSQSNLVFH